MKKSTFLTLATLLTAIIATPSVCMDNPLENALDITKVPNTITFTLHLQTAEQIARNKSWNKHDKRVCSIVGIPWEKNNNTYYVNKALFKNPGETNCTNWIKYWPKNLPMTKDKDNSLIEPFQHTLKAPTSLPAGFVQRLQNEKSITIKANETFENPVTIIFELGSIKDLSGKTQIFPTSTTEMPKQETTAKTTSSSTNKYIFGGLAGIAGLIE